MDRRSEKVKKVLGTGSITRYCPATAKVAVWILVGIFGVERTILNTSEEGLNPVVARELPWSSLAFGAPLFLACSQRPIFYYLLALPLSKAQKDDYDLAHCNALTCSPNRTLLKELIAQTMALSKRKRCFGAHIALDFDNFKPVTNAYGHGIGRMLLIAVTDTNPRYVERSLR